jgi:hypothetical protein
VSDPGIRVEPARSLTVIRPDDLVVLTVRFHNVVLHHPHQETGARLVPVGDVDDPPLLIVEFPPQAIGEDTFFEDGPFKLDPPDQQGPRELAAPGDVEARFSAPSRLVFTLPRGDVAFDYTLSQVLALIRSQALRVSPGFAPLPTPHPYIVAPRQTALELPYRLVVSPDSNARWDHTDVPVTDAGGSRTELWHSRMVGTKTIRPLWRGVVPSDFNPSLNEADLEGLVKHGQIGDPPADVDNLLLTSLGAWLDARADWPPGRGVESWRHRMTMGRDHYVRVVQAGFLFPFGHRASMVKITERKLQRGPDEELAAYLRQRIYIVVREHEKTFADSHRAFPFSSVRITTLTTPDLRSPDESAIRGKGQQAFWPRVGDPPQDFQFHVVATDRGTPGGVVEFVTPLAFIATSAAVDADIRDWMGLVSKPTGPLFADEPIHRRERSLGRQPVTFAPASSSSPVPSDTRLDADSIELRVVAAAESTDPSVPPFLPALQRATARISSLREATGRDEPISFHYDDTFVGSGSHPLDVWAVLDGGGPQLELSPAESGGLAAPNFSVTRLSRSLGPVGPTTPGTGGAAETFDPKVFFGDGPRLLGGLTLADLIDQLPITGVGDLFNSAEPKLPRLATIHTNGRVQTVLQWQTPLKLAPGETVAPTLRLEVVRERSAGDPVSSVSGELVGFSIGIPTSRPLLVLRFRSVTFRTETGRKPDFGAVFDRLEFDNELRFVNTLARILDLSGFADPPSLEVTDAGLELGYTLGVPTVGVGAFTLQNLSLSAGLSLPLGGTDSTKLALAFAERHNPCIVTYSALGGAAFLGVTVGLEGLQALEGSIEFGGAIALNLGVASGGVALMAGVYYSHTASPATGDSLAGFVRCIGELDVLGLISISAQFFLELSYKSGPDRVSGTASLTVEVEVLFFSESVTVTVQREFAKGADPKFEDVVHEPNQWGAYCTAFEGED